MLVKDLFQSHREIADTAISAQEKGDLFVVLMFSFQGDLSYARFIVFGIGKHSDVGLIKSIQKMELKKEDCIKKVNEETAERPLLKSAYAAAKLESSFRGTS